MPVERLDLPAAPRIALVLAGGNALGAYHAGLYQALHEAAVEPDWIVGTSIGAVNGAIIAGNPRDRRLDRLRELWRPGDESIGWPMPWDVVPESWRRTGAVVSTLLGGRAGLFGPLGPLGSWWMRDPAAGSPALYDTQMLRESLAKLVDFDRLNSCRPRFTALAVDIETGDEVAFDTQRQRIAPDHIRASAALLTAYPAVEIDGRLLGDGGLSMNLPLDPVMSEADEVPTLCVAADLLPLSQRRPRTLGEVIGRMQDLGLAAQSRRTIERWQAVYAARSADDLASVTIVRLAYSDQRQEVAGKALDFSPASVRQRWTAGYDDGARTIERLNAGVIAVGRPGLSVVSG